VIKLDLSGR